MAAMMQALETRAQESEGKDASRRTDDSTPPIKIGLVGYGPHGREIARNLSQLPSAPLVAVADHYGQRNAAPSASTPRPPATIIIRSA